MKFVTNRLNTIMKVMDLRSTTQTQVLSRLSKISNLSVQVVLNSRKSKYPLVSSKIMPLLS